ncbi:hypothetical protein D3C83_85190 [compost metagenome]
MRAAREIACAARSSSSMRFGRFVRVSWSARSLNCLFAACSESASFAECAAKCASSAEMASVIERMPNVSIPMSVARAVPLMP